MADSLRDQLLKTGLVQKLKAEARDARPPEPRKPPRDARKPDGRPGGKGAPPAQRPRGGGGGEMDLARAYALRDRSEREQRDQEKRAAEQKAREKAERKRKLAALLEGKALNVADADVARHFPHGDKIRRVYCTAEQLAAVNAGEIAVVQHLGRYLLVAREVGEAVREASPEALVLLSDPGAVAEDGVPDDLVW
ncbi:DUF2058 family protein [Dokdonella sp. MW10]|uniref:DUF2058 family protein n=1 Tax=Dokdonella sp. MW10 TaxID=2992926 RepID=UPI003F808FFC